jgi:hypothetical protein
MEGAVKAYFLWYLSYGFTGDWHAVVAGYHAMVIAVM